MKNWENRARSSIGNRLIRFDLYNNQEKIIKYFSNDFHVITYTQNFNHTKGETIPIHWHDALQIIWVYEGELVYAVNDQQFTLDSTEILLINSNQLHHAETIQDDAKTLCLNFQLDFFHPKIVNEYFIPMFNKTNFTFARLVPTPILKSKMKNIIKETEENINYLQIFSFILEVIESFMKDAENQLASKSNLEDQELFNSLLTFVHENYDKKITLNSLSQEVGANFNKITKLFNEYAQSTPIQYVNSYRLYKAREEVLYTCKPISEISDELGFNNCSYFIEQFRNRYGLSPLKFRQQFAD